MEFQDVIRRRRMVRRYDLERPVPPEIVDRVLRNAVRAPSAGLSQGWGFLVLDTPADLGRFRTAVTPETDADRWFAAQVDAPVLVVAHSNKRAYVDRYSRPDKDLGDQAETFWPAPYWDIDTGFASMVALLTAVDAGLGACFFGIPVDRMDTYKRAFDVPAEFSPIGAISLGYPAEPPADLSGRRKPFDDVVHRGRWTS